MVRSNLMLQPGRGSLQGWPGGCVPLLRLAYHRRGRHEGVSHRCPPGSQPPGRTSITDSPAAKPPNRRLELLTRGPSGGLGTSITSRALQLKRRTLGSGATTPPLRHYSPEPRPGDRVVLKLSGREKQEFTILFIGPKSLRLKQVDGTEVVVSRDKVRRQLGIPASPGRRIIRP